MHLLAEGTLLSQQGGVFIFALLPLAIIRHAAPLIELIDMEQRLLAVSMACVGIISEMLLLPENLMLLAYIFCFLGYFVLLRESCQSPSYAGDPSVDG